MNHVRKALDAIATQIGELKDSIQKHSRAEHDAEERKRKQEPLPNQPKKVSAVISFDDETARDTKTEANRQYATQKSIKNAAWAAFVAASIYAFIAACQIFQIQESNRISRESLESVQRAYLTFREAREMRALFQKDTPGHEKGGHFWLIDALYDNAGATSAIKVITWADYATLKDDPVEEQFRGKQTSFSDTSFGPRANPTFGGLSIPEENIFGKELGDIPVTAATETTLNRNLYFWGWIQYRDIFPDTPVHVTEFCLRLQEVLLIPVEGQKERGITFRFNHCRKHNCTDEQCEDYPEISRIPHNH